MAYNLKRIDYHKIGEIIDERSYKAYCQVKYLMIATGRRIEDFVEKNIAAIELEFNDPIKKINEAIKRDGEAGKEFLESILSS